MTLSSIISRVSYAGNGSTTAFSFPYYFLANADLIVILRTDSTGVEVTKTITTHYTITGAGVAAGGTVTMVTSPAVGETLIIYRDPTQTQDLDLVENDPMPAEEIEERFDKLTMMVQRLTNRMDRATRLTEGYSGSFDPKLPATFTALYVLRVNAAGTAFELVTNNTATFDSIAPSTTKGDLIAFNGSANVRQGVGGNFSFLVADSAEATGVKWSGQLTAKGDILARTATDVARLAVGNNDDVLVADSTTATGLKWSAAASGGGGSLQWVEDSNAPLSAIENSQRVYLYEAALGQSLYCVIRVPAGYTAGKQIKLRITHYTPDISGTALISSVATLVRTGTDAMTSTTNQRTSTNVAQTVPGTANIPQAVILDLTSSTGQINSVSVAAGDLIKVAMTRGTDTSTSDLRVPVYGAECTFNG